MHLQCRDHRRQKPIVGNKIPAFWGSPPGWKPRRWKRTHPPAGRASHWNPRIRSQGPTSPWTSGEALADSGFSWSRRWRTLAPRPSDSLLSDAAWAGRGPPGGLRRRCASGTRPGIYYQRGAGAPTRSSSAKKVHANSPIMVMGRTDEGEPDLWAGRTRANRIFESFGEQCLGSTLNVTAKEEYGLILVTLKHPVSGDCPLFTEKKVI